MIASTRRPLNRRLVLALAAGAMFAGTAALAAPPANTIKPGLFSGRADTAILGYDPVAYFTDGKPVKGQDNLVFDYLGAKWKFASRSHLDLFKADPEKYAPQYGGYCAYGVTQDALREAYGTKAVWASQNTGKVLAKVEMEQVVAAAAAATAARGEEGAWGGLMEKSSTKKPKNSKIVVCTIGLPVSIMVACIACSISIPLPRSRR